MIMTMHSEAAWSHIAPTPVFVYDPEYDAYLCFWNGVAMTRTYALIIYSWHWLNIMPSYSQREVAMDEFSRLYRAGAFRTREWDEVVDRENWISYHTLLSKLIDTDNTFFPTLVKQYNAKQMLEYFKYNRETIVEADTETF